MSFPRLHTLVTVALATTAVTPVLAAEANVITGIKVESGTPTRVVIQGTREPTFTVFRLGQPPRVVVDLAGADVSAVSAPVESSQGDVAMITASQFKDPAHPIGRVVVGLNRDVPFDVKAEGTAVVVTLLEGRQAAAAPQPAAQKEPEAVAAAPEKKADEPIVVEGAPSEHHATKLLAVRATQKNGGALLTLQTDGPVERYEVQEVQNPTRLVVDLYGIKSAPRKLPNLKVGPLSRIRLGKHDTHVRVVFDARSDTLPSFDVATSEEGLTVAFGSTPRPAENPAVAAAAPEQKSEQVAQAAAPVEEKPAPAAEPAQEPKREEKRAEVKDVRFDDKGGFYRLKIALDGNAEHRLTTDNPRLKVLELSGADLPATLERSLDTTAFAGPVQSVATFRDPDQPGVVKVAVDLSNGVEHRVWARGDALYWDFRAQDPRPARSAPTAQTDSTATRAAGYAVEAVSLSRQGTPADRRYTGKKITIDLKDADILNVLRLIAEVSKLNIIASDEVKGTVTIKLRNVPWDQALDIILKVKGLGQEKQGNIIRVAPQKVLQLEKEIRDAEAQRRVVAEPTIVKLLPVNYANATEMLPQVQALLSPRGKATVDKRTNVIIVEDIRDNLVQAEKLVRTLDTQTPQVLIEARIVEATSSYSRTLGIQWGYGLNFSDANGNPTGLIFPHNIATSGGADDPGALRGGLADPGVVGPSNYAVNLPANAGGPGASALGFSFGSIGNTLNVNLRLSAAEADGQIKIVSSPKVATLDNKTAKISQGVDIPVARVSAAGVQTQLIPSALELEVTPHVTADGSVLMKLKVTNNAPDFARQVQGVPAFTKKEADTEVMVRDGETTVVGGIYTRNYSEQYRRSPFFGSLPVIGWLFKAQDKNDERKELLAFITPRIVNRRQASVSNTDLGKGE
ncbi:MAG: type IV pilus secretin PilQ [Myxococcota bacterium]